MKKILILTTVLFAMLFAGCNREIIDPEDNLKGDATISVQISGYAATKALDTVTANIKVKKLRVILVNAVGNIAANKYVENAAGVTAIENIVVPVGNTLLAIARNTCRYGCFKKCHQIGTYQCYCLFQPGRRIPRCRCCDANRIHGRRAFS